MKRSLLFASLLVAFTFTVLLTGPNAPLRSWLGLAPSPPILGQVPEFLLVAEDGKPYGSASLKGRPWLASFFYATCPGPCPRLIERLKIVRRDIAPARLAFVSITVDPVTDTPAVLAAYKTARGIGSDDAWSFLTGPPDQVIPLVQRGFMTGVERSDGSPEGNVIHGLSVALVDGEGHIRGFYSTESDDSLARLKRDVDAIQ